MRAAIAGLHERVARRDHLLGGGRGLDHVDVRPRAPLVPGAAAERLGRLRAERHRLGRGLCALRHTASQWKLSSGLRRLARSGRCAGRAPTASGVAVVNWDTEAVL